MGVIKKAFLICTLINYVTQVNAQDTVQHVTGNRFNSTAQQSKPYVILISADGFRFDLADKYHAANLIRLRRQGVAAPFMTPSFPSLTFPNHYSIVTGLYPSHHGLVDNDFYDENKKAFYNSNNKKAVEDSSWYNGTPLWVLAEQQQMLSASFYWVASESAIQGIRPTYYFNYNEKISIDARIETVIKWLQLPADRRPHLISFYFPEVDHAEHTYGPESGKTEAAVQFVDKSIGNMVAAVDTLHLPVNFIFVSDHGMTAVDTLHTLPLPAAVDTAKFIVPYGDVLLHLYAKNKKDILPAYKALLQEAQQDFNVYLAAQTPPGWHYSTKDDVSKRIGDILLVPRLPKVFSISRKPVKVGKHGFDPAMSDMHATFYAWGPAFKQHLTIAPFENIHIYPLVANILGLPYKFAIDGKAAVLNPILAVQPK